MTIAVFLLVTPGLALSRATPAAAATSPPVQPKPVLAWGTNFVGQAGNGGIGDQHACCKGIPYYDPYNDYPVQASGLTGAIAVSAAGGSSAAIMQGHDPDGTPDPALNTVWTWGVNLYGEGGSRPPDVCREPEAAPATLEANSPDVIVGYWTFPCAKQPVQVRGPGGSGYLTGIVAIADGGDHMLALRSDGTVWGWGSDFFGDLGVSPPSIPNPDCPPGVTRLGQPYTTGDPFCVLYPVQVPGLTGATAVAAGLWHGAAIVHHSGEGPDDTVWAWGDNTDGELGQGWDCSDTSGCASSVPVAVPGVSNVTALAIGGDVTMAIVRGHAADGSDNELWTWGGWDGGGVSGVNETGALPNQYNECCLMIDDQPKRVLDASGTGYFTGAVAVSTDGSSTVAVKYDPTLGTTTVWNWGRETPAASGTPGGPAGTNGQWPTPRQVRGAGGNGVLTGATAVATALGSAYALLADGTVWGWGTDWLGELAWPPSSLPDGVPISTFPVRARGVTGATALAGGHEYVLALADTPPPAPPVVTQRPSDPPPVLPFEQLPTSAAPVQPPQAPASVPVVNPGAAPGTVNPPPQPPPPSGSVSSQPVSGPIQAASPVHAPAAQQPGHVQGSQLVAGTAPVPGSPGALTPSAGDRPTPTDQLAMVRHDDAADLAWAIGIAAAAAGALAGCLVATSRSRRPPAIRPAPAWAAATRPHAPVGTPQEPGTHRRYWTLR